MDFAHSGNVVLRKYGSMKEKRQYPASAPNNGRTMAVNPWVLFALLLVVKETVEPTFTFNFEGFAAVKVTGILSHPPEQVAQASEITGDKV